MEVLNVVFPFLTSSSPSFSYLFFLLKRKFAYVIGCVIELVFLCNRITIILNRILVELNSNSVIVLRAVECVSTWFVWIFVQISRRLNVLHGCLCCIFQKLIKITANYFQFFTSKKKTKLRNLFALAEWTLSTWLGASERAVGRYVWNAFKFQKPP